MLSHALFDTLAALARIAATWMARWEQRRALEDLDDHLLRDIGVSQAEAALQAGQPFWRSDPRLRRPWGRPSGDAVNPRCASAVLYRLQRER